jgi:protein-disulfide isomerase
MSGDFRTASIIARLLLMCAGAVTCAPPVVAATGTPEVAGLTALATIGSQRLTESDVKKQAGPAFDELESEFQLKLRQLQLQQEQARYDLLKEQLDKLLDAKALELESRARGKAADAVLADVPVPPVTEAEIQAFYVGRKDQITESFEKIQPRIAQYLASQHKATATRGFYDALRVKHGISSQLAPYRVEVAAAGPMRGKSDALVTIVEFGDFQCPFCRRAEDTLRTILANHPDNVRLVFRQLPLTSLHPNAATAAEAAVCAGRQEQFWPMHDAMYADQTALTAPALKETARRLGLNVDLFSVCMTDKGTADAINQDVRAARELNISATPAFIINGRPLTGSVPAEQFESIIAEELHLANATRG